MPNETAVLEPEEVESDDEIWIADREDLPDEIPSRFLLQTFTDDGMPLVYMWGLQIKDIAIAFTPTGGSITKAASAEKIHRLFRRSRELYLLWIDRPET